MVKWGRKRWIPGVVAFVLLPVLAVAAEVKSLDVAKFLVRSSSTMLTTIVDCRAPEDFHAFRFRDSINVPAQDFMSNQSELAGQTIILVCYRGKTSQQLGQALIQAGFSNVYTLEGGILGVLPFMAESQQSKPQLAQAIRDRLIVSVPIPGLPAPNFKLPGADGKEYQLKDFKGQAGLLVFFGDPLEPDLAPAFDEVAALAAGGEGVELVVVLSQAAAQRAEELNDKLKKDNTQALILLDSDGSVAQIYGVEPSVPTISVVDKHGTLWLQESGDLNKPLFYYSEQSAMQLAQKAVAGEQVPYPQSPIFGTMKATEVLIGAQAPDFTLNDLDGEPHSLSEYRGKPVVLIIWTIGCPYSRQQIQELSNYYLYRKSKVDFEVVAVEQAQPGMDMSTSRGFLSDIGCAFPVLVDPGGTLTQPYLVISVPVVLVLDKDGKVLDVSIGYDKDLAVKLDTLLDY